MNFRPTIVEVDLSRLRENFRKIRSLVEPSTCLIPMVKGNAYGHGDVEVARVLEAEGADFFGVSLVEEALRLRQSGLQKTVLLFGGCDGVDAKTLKLNDFIPVLSDLAQLKELAAANEKLSIHLKINTGMNRLGFDESELPELIGFLSKNEKLEVCGVGTHLIESESEEVTIPQEKSFERQLQLLREAKVLQSDVLIHIYNSGAVFQGGRRIESAVKPGIALYGIGDESLQPVMSLKSQVLKARELEPGEKVSYSATWEAKKPTDLIVVPIGYGDGFFRSFGNRGKLLFRGERAPIVGVVCMDYLMADVTDIVAKSGKKPLRGEEIVLFGEQDGAELRVEELAELIETIPYEIITSVGARVPRHYVSD